MNFSIKKRWSDAEVSERNRNIIFVRTDYYDHYNYYQVSACRGTFYSGINMEDETDLKNLRFLLKNIFGYENFREGQLKSIENILKGRNTLSVLPTSGGKSLIYQFTGMLIPAMTVVVEPIVALMKDQKDNLDSKNIVHTDFINSTQNINKKTLIQKYFARGKYQFMWISPERFQSEEFREKLRVVSAEWNIGLVVIDEAHCLSEWGHDFRTSYLNLAKTIQKFCPFADILCLTATASVHVQTDIRNEFHISREDVKTVARFTRKELTFVIRKSEDKYETLKELIETLNRKRKVLSSDGQKTRAGIVFSRFVNGHEGCYMLASRLSNEFESDVRWFSGSAPRSFHYDDQQFNNYKAKVHEDFRNNQFPLLVATKAFGMGIDKDNIRYTIHYGIPESLEALYQEAGRAGRDGKNAACYVIISEETVDQKYLDRIFSLETSISEVKEIQQRIGSGGRDVFHNLFLWQNNLDDIDDEVKNILRVYEISERNKEKTVFGKRLSLKKQQLEKAVYKLRLLGIVGDWVIINWDTDNPVMKVYFDDFDRDTIERELVGYLAKYGTCLDFKTEKSRKNFEHYYKLYEEHKDNPVIGFIKILITWQHENILYNRRKQIQTVYEKCLEFSDRPEKLKQLIESYFYVGDVTNLYDHIIDDPTDIDTWFKVFFESDDVSVKDEKQLSESRNSLIRLLESLSRNVGLNFIYGMLGFLTEAYSRDAQERFRHALSEIVSMPDETVNRILENIYSLSFNMKENEKIKLSKELVEYFPQRVYDIHDGMKDNYSLNVILKNSMNRIEEKIRGLIYGCEQAE